MARSLLLYGVPILAQDVVGLSVKPNTGLNGCIRPTPTL